MVVWAGLSNSDSIGYSYTTISKRLKISTLKVEIFASWGSYGPPDTPGSAGSGLHNTEQSNYSKCPEQLVNKCFTEDKSVIKKDIFILKVKEK